MCSFIARARRTLAAIPACNPIPGGSRCRDEESRSPHVPSSHAAPDGSMSSGSTGTDFDSPSRSVGGRLRSVEERMESSSSSSLSSAGSEVLSALCPVTDDRAQGSELVIMFH